MSPQKHLFAYATLGIDNAEPYPLGADAVIAKMDAKAAHHEIIQALQGFFQVRSTRNLLDAAQSFHISTGGNIAF